MGVWLEQGLSRRGVLESLPLESPVWEPASRLLKPSGEIKNAVISGGATAGADGWRREQQADQEGRVEEKRGEMQVGAWEFQGSGGGWGLSSHPTLVTTIDSWVTSPPCA